MRNRRIDLARFVFALLVIVIHSHLFEAESPVTASLITDGIARIAVPSFFVISGYYFYGSVSRGKSVRKYFRKILLMYAVYEALDLVFFTMAIFPDFPRVNPALFVWRIITQGMGGIYWYIFALVVIEIALIPVWRKGYTIIPLAAGFVLYIWLLLRSSYSFIPLPRLYREGYIDDTVMILAKGAFFIAAGGAIHKYEQRLKSSGALVIAGVLLLLTESAILHLGGLSEDTGDAYISLIFAAPALVLWLLSNPGLRFDTQIPGRMSFHIYMMHLMIYALASSAISSVWAVFPVTVFLSAAISYMICRVQDAARRSPGAARIKNPEK